MRIRFAPTALVIIGIAAVVLWVLGYRLEKVPQVPVGGGGDKPIVIGDGASIDISDGGVFTPENLNGTLTAPGTLLAKPLSKSGTLMAAYQEAGVTKTPMCTGQGDCMIVVKYAADGTQPGSCSDDAAETVCGAVRLLYLASTKSVTALNAPNVFQSPTSLGAPYMRTGFHVIWVQWTQRNAVSGSNPNSGFIQPSNPQVHQSTVKMCFLPAGGTTDGSCSL